VPPPALDWRKTRRNTSRISHTHGRWPGTEGYHGLVLITDRTTCRAGLADARHPRRARKRAAAEDSGYRAIPKAKPKPLCASRIHASVGFPAPCVRLNEVHAAPIKKGPSLHLQTAANSFNFFRR